MKKRKLISLATIIGVVVLSIACNRVNDSRKAGTIWSVEKAQAWGKNNPWYTGANFNPSTAINQLETWQEDTFDPETIDKELGWAASIGFNMMRVYLHHIAWKIDPNGFKSRIDEYLIIADKHGIKTMFVIFDDCWDPVYTAGKQPSPKPGVHNSGWVQDPGAALYDENEQVRPEMMEILEEYVKDILSSFATDHRIAVWDLYNEPGNSGYGNRSMVLLEAVFSWAREINPAQPITVGVWNYSLKDLNHYQIENSDIITYHNYNDEVHHRSAIDTLLLYQRPMICTEYMARTRSSRFQNILPLLKEYHVGAINWGLVAGKSNTIYAWDAPIPDGSEPEIWFHDIFRTDGSVFDQEEINLIKQLNGK